jgi:hypothetical protein
MTKSTGDTPELDAAEAEANNGKRTIVVGELTLNVPRKFKRMKVLRCMQREDLFGAITVVFGEEVADQLEELELEERETVKFFEDFTVAVTGVDLGNLPSSQA